MALGQDCGISAPWQADCSLPFVDMTDGSQIEGLPLNNDAPANEEGVELEAERLPEHQYCVFRSGRERYCLSVSEVEEVVEWPVLTRMPLSPQFLMGIFNLRGVIIPVLDIAYAEGRRTDRPPTHLVVAAWSGEAGRDVFRVGLPADEMLGSYATSEPLLVEEAPTSAVHCAGLLRHNDGFALALDLRRLTEAFPIPTI